MRYALLLTLLLAQTLCLAQNKLDIPSRPPAEYGTQSKKARDAYEQAMAWTRYKDMRQILYWLERALEADPAFILAHYRRGEALYASRQLQLAEQALAVTERLQAQATTKIPLVDLYFYLGECYLFNANYAQAMRCYKLYLESKPINRQYMARAGEGYKKAEFSQQAKTNPIRYEPRNLGPNINSQGVEFMPYLTADGNTIFFASRRAGNTGGYDQLNGSFDEDFYTSTQDGNGNWQEAVNIGAPINTAGNEGTGCISPDGQYVIFTGCSRNDGVGDCDLYIARFEGRQWSKPTNLGAVVNSRWWDSHPNLSSDGRTLFFASSRPGGYGASDIWYSKFENGAWQAPQNMGASINTTGHEYSPFLHADDATLYFSSDGHKGFGNLDLFLSRRTDSTWGQPRNLGYPLNTEQDEHSLFITTDGSKAYITMKGRGSLGHDDIFVFELDSTIRPRTATYVRGTVTDSLTGKPVPAEVNFIDLATRDTIRTVTTNSATGRFLLNLPLQRNYAAFVDAQGYLFYSQNFSLVNLGNVPYYDVSIRLQPVRAGARITLNNIFFETAKADLKPESNLELEKLLAWLRNNPTAKIEVAGHTDDQGSVEYNLALSKRRAAAVVAYLTTKGIVTTRLVARGYGKDKPVATNSTEAGRARNRRTEFLILQTK